MVENLKKYLRNEIVAFIFTTNQLLKMDDLYKGIADPARRQILKLLAL